MAGFAIETTGLTKTFERKPERGIKGWFDRRPKATITAVDHVDLQIREGELFGLLGPNGAGKTTLVKLLSTLLLPGSGSARICGLDIERDADAIRRKVGVVLGGERALYWRLTGRENLWYFSQLYNMQDAPARNRIKELLDVVGIADRADERVENYSKGMKQRLHIARGLLTDPEVLLLDEPTIGLDPQAARTLRSLVSEVARGLGHTVVMSTHYMYEADALCDRVAIMNRGKIVACDSPAALKGRHADGGAFLVSVRTAGGEDVRRGLEQAGSVGAVISETNDAATGVVTFRLAIRAGAADEAPQELARAVADAKGRLVALRQEEPTLEDVFVRLTGETLGVDAPPGGKPSVE
ncbi:MAG: ABC transporter ATP-binding protein [Euryarchaeota archaeon]|nr:ABC transporter ATP-binding protein [Euryarchaeota archaeon]